VSAAVQIYSRDFDNAFFKLPNAIRTRIESRIDRLGLSLERHPHGRLKGVDFYRLRVGD